MLGVDVMLIIAVLVAWLALAAGLAVAWSRFHAGMPALLEVPFPAEETPRRPDTSQALHVDGRGFAERPLDLFAPAGHPAGQPLPRPAFRSREARPRRAITALEVHADRLADVLGDARQVAVRRVVRP